MVQCEKKQHLSSSYQLHIRGEGVCNNEISTTFTARAREVLIPGEIKQGEFSGDADLLGTVTLMRLLYGCNVKDKLIYLDLYCLRNI